MVTDADMCIPSAKKVKTEDALALNEPIDLEEEHTLYHTIVSLLATRYDPDHKTNKRSAYAYD